MRPDDPLLDADLTWLDDELEHAGAAARRAHARAARPSGAFEDSLRQRLMAGLAADVAADTAAHDAGRATAAEHVAWSPVALEPRVVARRAAPVPRARWALVAAAALTAVVAAGAIGARLTFPNPVASGEPTHAPTDAAFVPTTGPEAATDAPIVVPPTGAAATDGPIATATHGPEPTRTPAPTEPAQPTPKPTSHPEPTQPPVGPMDLVVTSCPGGVVIDWTRPSSAATHYRVLRTAGGEVPSTYPADGAFDVTTAASSGADVTSGYDATLDGGATASYRAFAFDAADHQLAFSPYRTVGTTGRVDLGTPTIENLGAGKIRVGWTAGEIPSGCFSTGKVVVSESDPDPGALKGSFVATLVTDRLATSVVVDALPSGGTYYLRYDVLRSTGTGSFLVGRSSVIQVTIP